MYIQTDFNNEWLNHDRWTLHHEWYTITHNPFPIDAWVIEWYNITHEPLNDDRLTHNPYTLL